MPCFAAQANAARPIDSRYSWPGGSEGEAYDVDAARRRPCAAAFRPARPRRSGPALAGSCLVAVLPGCGLALDGRRDLARSSCLLGGCSLGFGGDALEGRGLGLGSDDDLP